MEKLKGNKPNIRFPEFKDDWQHSKLSELLSEIKMKNKVLENYLRIQYNLEYEIFRKIRKTGGFFDISQMMEE